MFDTLPLNEGCQGPQVLTLISPTLEAHKISLDFLHG